ncbi:Rv3235 family protein [Curtobacterium sp. RRHDQ10]|uniref:Rv3235 family protein n=1 Tax=Curtobacterium phyllosphaerae TaxID=3413379 RepID=UPI003BF1985F
MDEGGALRVEDGSRDGVGPPARIGAPGHSATRSRPGHRDRQSLKAVETVFAVQTTPRHELPDPTQIARDLARCVVEVLAGARELDQIARWLSEDVQRNLQQRVSIAARARAVRRQTPQRPVFRIGSVLVDEPANGVAEATVIVHAKARTRAVAIRLEGLDGRWRATAISVL